MTYNNFDIILKLSDRVWMYESCRKINQQDLLAANNILKEDHRNSCDLMDAEEAVKP